MLALFLFLRILPNQSLRLTEYNRLLDAINGHKLSVEQKQRIEALHSGRRKACLVTPHRKNMQTLTITDEMLRQEIAYVKNKVKQVLQQGRLIKKRKRDQEAAQKNHTAVDCSCCFDGFPIQDMVACREEGHLFCLECLKMFAENQIFGQGSLGVDKRTKKPSHELQCFHGDGCSSGFDRHFLEKALNTKALSKYDELQCKVNLDAAGLTDTMFACPKCGFEAELPVGQKVFTCPIADCVRVCFVVPRTALVVQRGRPPNQYLELCRRLPVLYVCIASLFLIFAAIRVLPRVRWSCPHTPTVRSRRDRSTLSFLI